MIKQHAKDISKGKGTFREMEEKKKLRGNEEGGGGKVVSCDISMEEERLNLLVP